jgi:D-aspartate ligase
MTPGAIVVGAHANGLGVIRALSARNVPVVSIATRPFDIAQHSRWVRECHALPSLHQRQESLVELLDHHAVRWYGWAVFPTNDDALIALSQHHAHLSTRYRLPCQPWAITSHLMDKDRMHALAIASGLDVPVCHGPATAATAALPGLAYPLIVKPVRHDHLISTFGVKLFVADDSSALRTCIERLAAVGLDGLVFESIPGPDSEIFVYCVYVDGRGEPSPGVTVRKLRQNPPFIGGARAAEVTDEIPALRDATIAMLRRAGFHGMAFAEFKRDARTGRFVFIEVNGRAVLFNSILPPTGVDLVAMAWSDVVLGRRLDVRPTGWRGAWIHLQADVGATIRYRRVERLGLREIVAPYMKPKTFAVWSLRDPRPFAAQTALLARRALGGAGATRPPGTSP